MRYKVAAAGVVAVVLVMGWAVPAQAQGYRFTKVADSVADDLDPFGFQCSAINNHSEVAFRADRLTPQALVPGIYRADRDGRLTTIAEDRSRFDFIELNLSLNEHGEVSFLARLGVTGDFELEVMRGDGRKLTTLASTASDRFNQFGSYTSINDDGAVAFKAQLDDFDEGLFSATDGGRDGLTTHYQASTSQFGLFGTRSRPSINNHGDVAFEERVDDTFVQGIFKTDDERFATIAAPDPDPNLFIGWPVLNDAGTVAFHRSFFDETIQQGVEQLVTGEGGRLRVVADTRGPFSAFGFFFGFQPPALNQRGDVAFYADLDDGSAGIFAGRDRVIKVGDILDGSPVSSLLFCEEGLNDRGELSFAAVFEDPNLPEGRRAGVFRATRR